MHYPSHVGRYPSQDEVGGFFDDVGGAFKSVVKSPITKAVAGGLSFVVPPAGIAASAAIQTADTAITVAEAGKGKPKGHPLLRYRDRIITQIRNTKAQAKKGNPDAARAMSVLAARRKKLKSKGIRGSAAAQALLKKRAKKIRMLQRKRKKLRARVEQKQSKVQKLLARLKRAKARIKELEGNRDKLIQATPSDATAGILVHRGQLQRGHFAKVG